MKKIVLSVNNSVMAEEVLVHVLAADLLIVNFRIGWYEPPTPEVLEVQAKIKALLGQITLQEKTLFQCWHGRLEFHEVGSRMKNELLTDEMRVSFQEAALIAHPGWAFSHSWDTVDGGLMGYSVRLRRKGGTK